MTEDLKKESVENEETESTKKTEKEETTEDVTTEEETVATKVEATDEEVETVEAEADVEDVEAEVEEEVETEGETATESEIVDEDGEEKEVQEDVDEVTAETEEEAVEEIKVATFSGDVEGETYTFEQLQAASDDYTDDEFHQLEGMYENTLSEIEEKEIVTGIVVSVDEKYVIVDIGFKSEGIVPVNEFSNKVIESLQPGDEVEVFLDKVEDREGQLILSRKKADILQAWENLEKSYETGEVIEGFIQRRIKGGMVVDVFGIDAFLPGSQIDVRPVRDFDAYVGKTMEFQVVKLNMQAENVVVSHRALIESDLEDQRQEILETIEAGQVLEGIVKNITDFGVFIDLGGVDGLLHITDLSWGRVDHPEEIVKLDQKMNVAVIDFDENSKRVSLGLKQLQPHPWDQIFEKFPENMRVQGRVVSIADYGAFIELEKGVEGLIHISEMSWTQHIKHPSQLVQKDDIVECVVLNINEEEKKISLGVKQLEKDPWEDLLERYPIGSKHKGVIRNLTNFGVFVELEPGIDGLIHVSDLSWTEKVEHPNEVVDKAQEVDIVILAVDFDNRRITLGHKQVDDNPWEKYAEEYGPGSKVEGEVSKITDKGMFVKLALGVDAFLPADKLTEPVEDLNVSFKEGDKVAGLVVEFDEPSKTIEISQKEEDIKKPKKKVKTSKKPDSIETGTPTLGEVSGLADKLAEKEKSEKVEKAEKEVKAEKADKTEKEAKTEKAEEAEKEVDDEDEKDDEDKK